MKFILDERFILNEDDTVATADVDAPAESAAAETVSTETSGIKPLQEPDEDFWGEYYKTCKTQEDFHAFWNGMSEIPADPEMSPEAKERKKAGFYKYEFGKHAEAIKKLRSEFTASIEKFGWVPRRNPMLSFLHYAFPVDSDMRLNVGPDDFTVLWGSLEKGLLKQVDLQNIDKARLGNLNIIYNNNFYALSSADQRGYLKLQERIINATKLPTAAQTNKAVVFANIYSATGNLKDATAAINPGAPLRKLVAAEQIMDDLLGQEDTEIEADNKQVANVLNQIKSEDHAKKVLSFVVDAFSIQHAKTIEAANKKTGGKIFMQRDQINAYPKQNETKEYVRLLGGSTMRYTAEALTELLLKLAEKAKIYKP